MPEQSLTVREIIRHLEQWAPPQYQESYDNSGLLTGSPDMAVTGVLITLDCLESVVDEAVEKKANLIIAHHPIIFKGLPKLTGSTYVERTIIKAIRSGIAIYAIHTNLDNVASGVNRKICQRLGLINTRVLAPKRQTLGKLVTFIPSTHTEEVLNALHEAGAGNIGNYANCSFRVDGTGTFKPLEGADPFLGKENEQEYVNETRVELIFPVVDEGKILAALRASHPYEEIAYYISVLTNENQEVGSGMIGELPDGVEPMAFLESLKNSMEAKVVRYTRPPDHLIKNVAVCGGAGSFLLKKAIQAGADAYVSADFKYHEFFDADGKIMVADIGHYETEVFTKELIRAVLMKKFPTFAINFSETVTNPISYI